ncbi:hypothetical protein HYW76_03470 [Candidatus Pacearchaeota archaeon]|nr:hypothetical protein [Candidatus Pacearchaeota archaeon]
MLCAGRISERQYLFIEAIQEDINGNYHIVGVRSMDSGHTSYDRERIFDVHNLGVDSRGLQEHITDGQLFDLLELWNNRGICEVEKRTEKRKRR